MVSDCPRVRLFIDCFMGDHIRPEGWDNWNHTVANEATAWYGEFGSSGPGARVGERLGWSRQLTLDQAAQFRPEVFLRGADGWIPVR